MNVYEGERDRAFRRAIDYLAANRIKGSIVEFGVHTGASLKMLATLAADRWPVHGVDSWQGLPQPSEHDSDQFSKGQFWSSEADARHTLGSLPVELHSTWFCDLPAGHFKEVALLHLDCDLYQSARDALNAVELVDGAVVMIDDFYCHRAKWDMGVRRAWDEWIYIVFDGLPSYAAYHPPTDFDRYSWHGRAFVVHQ